MGKLNLCLLVSYFMFVSLLSTFVLIGYLSNISLKINFPQIFFMFVSLLSTFVLIGYLSAISLKMNSPQIFSFKSFDPSITSCEDIEDMLFSALESQYYFKKRVSPFENHVNGFTIKAAMIDRLYQIEVNNEDDYDQYYELFCRMWHNGMPYFVRMTAKRGYCGFDCTHCGEGEITYCKSASFFLQHIFCSNYNAAEYQDMVDKIYLSLLQDGYKISEPDLLYYINPKWRRNVPTLKFLCIEHISKNPLKLSHFREELPQMLCNTINEFITCKDWNKI